MLLKSKFIKKIPQIYMTPFTRPTYYGSEDEFVIDTIKANLSQSSNKYGRLCEEWFEAQLGCERALLTSSCTHALEMCALLLKIKPGDEIIMPSFTFTSTANAFALRGATIVFIDIKPNNLNIDESLIEKAITEKTKAIVVMHYAGVSCDMDKISLIAKKHQVYLIEDAAQGMMAAYKNKPLGTIGHLGVYSFHQTKNFTSGGEGGLLIINDSQFTSTALTIRDKGSNRNAFLMGEVDKYSWVDIGSSYALSEIQASYLWGQLKYAHEINGNRKMSWLRYKNNLTQLAKKALLEIPEDHQDIQHNAHIFFIKVKNLTTRNNLISFLKNHHITATFHYSPLHSSIAGKKYGRFDGQDSFTTSESERLIRLPLFYGISPKEIDLVCSTIERFFNLN
jgi:dTDP-4-amino-4,6-dideoxygalactose transaminase